MTIISDKVVQIANNLHEVLMSLNYRRDTIKSVHFNDRRPHIYQIWTRRKVNFTQAFIIHLISVLNKTRKTISRSDVCSHDHKSLYSVRRLRNICLFGYLNSTLLSKWKVKNLNSFASPDLLLFIVFFFHMKYHQPPNLSSSTVIRARVLPSVCRSLTLSPCDPTATRNGKFIH